MKCVICGKPALGVVCRSCWEIGVDLLTDAAFRSWVLCSGMFGEGVNRENGN